MTPILEIPPRVRQLASELAQPQPMRRGSVSDRTIKCGKPGRAHWITPEFEPKRYDTRFFAARLPTGQVADDQTSEADHADWTDPARLLRDYATGSALMLPPTVVCVEQVAAAGSAAEFLAAEVSMAPITPVLVQTDDAVVIRCTLPWVHLPLAGV